MEITNTCEKLNVRNSDLTDSQFASSQLIKTRFEDVSLQESTFTNADLGNTRFFDVNLAGENIQEANLAENHFSNARLSKARFEDVNLQGSTFTDVNLAGTRFADVNLSGVTIEDANLAGMVVNGMLVTDLIRAFRSRPQVVLYAKDLVRMRAFYQGVFLLKVEHAEAEHVVLASSGWQLFIVQAPEAIVATICIADPPVRRTETPLKAVFDVKSLVIARGKALELGGGVDGVEREWTFLGRRVCDGYDPEGNVVQLREVGHKGRQP